MASETVYQKAPDLGILTACQEHPPINLCIFTRAYISMIHAFATDQVEKLLLVEVEAYDGAYGTTLSSNISVRPQKKMYAHTSSHAGNLCLCLLIIHFSQYMSLGLTSNTQSRLEIFIALSIPVFLCSLPQPVSLFIRFLLCHLPLINPAFSLSSFPPPPFFLCHSYISELFC